MRTLILTSLTITISAAFAGAHTLAVPFFSDDAPNTSGGSVVAGNAAFIGLKNTSSAPVLVEVTYLSEIDGVLVRQAPKRFQLKANEGVSWRPAKDDPSEGTGRLVPNIDSGTPPFGSVTITWRGGEFGANTLNGRYVQLSTSGAFAHVIKN